MILRIIILLFISLLCIERSGYGQDTLPISNAQKVRYLNAVGAKVKKMNGSFDRLTARAIKKMSARENRLKRLVMRFKPDIGKKIFGYSADSLAVMRSRIQNNLSKSDLSPVKNYFPYLDTLKQSVAFINKDDQNPSSKLPDSLEGLEGKIEAIESMQEFIAERQKLLQDNLKGIPGVSKHLKNINKDVYYFSEQINNYKSVFTERGKIEKLVASSLSNIPAFQDFMKQNSTLAGLFPFNGIPSQGGGNIPIVNGIPSRAALQQNIQQTIPVNAADINRMIQQDIPAPQSLADGIKNKLGRRESGADVSDFEVNSQKAKPFWKRFVFGSDVQFAKSSTYFPSTSDISLKTAYKLNDKSEVGTGIAYKLGLGSGWNKIKFTHQGIGFRSFLDWKMKVNFYVQGAYELNYNNYFKDIEVLKDYSKWQPSVLFGLVKKIKVSKKLGGNVQILYDFLHKQNIPNTQPLIFRFGYSLK